MVEKKPSTFSVLKRNIERLGCGDRAKALLGDALGQVSLLQAPQPVDLVFVDPPYEMMREPPMRRRVLDQIERCRGIMADKGFLILRSPVSPDEVEAIEGFHGPEVHHYSKEMWVFMYEPTESALPS